MRLHDYDTKTRARAVVSSTARITPKTTDEVREIVFEVEDESFAPVAGQCVGLLAPGDAELGQEHHFRLYTVADVPARLGDGTRRIALCVRRCDFIDDFSGERYRGRASNFLCDLKPGDAATLTGPYGLAFEVPSEPEANLIMIGMGTGIAPFRAFVKHLHEPATRFAGRIILLHGAHTGLDLLYRNDERDDFKLYYDRATFEAITALAASPEWSDTIDWSAAIRGRAEDIWKLLLQPFTYVYLAGLARIAAELDEVFAEIAGSEDRWLRRKAELLAGGRWVELLY